MDSRGALRRLAGQAGYLGAAALILFARMIPGPESGTGRAWPGPDLLFALSFAIALRRPDFAPAWAVGGVFLMQDILTGAPFGLWTAIALLAFELVRRQDRRFLELGFLPEWLFFAGLLLLARLAERAVLFVALVPQTAFSSLMQHYFVTVAIYPAVVLSCYLLLGVAKLSPDQAVTYQNRI